MNNTNQSPKETKKSEFLQPTPEQVKKMDEQVAEALKAANENAKAGRWANERQK